MPSAPAKIRKPLVAALLILAAGLLCLLARAPQPRPVELPDMVPAFAAAHLQPAGPPSSVGTGDRFRQWTVEDSSGDRALVYVEVTRQPQRVLEWTGELGFQGEGYQVSDGAGRSLATDGVAGEVRTAYLTGPGGRLAMAATDVGPDGLSPGGVSAAPRLLLDELGGQRSLWYLVRVTVMPAEGASTDRATQLLVGLVPALSRARSAAG